MNKKIKLCFFILFFTGAFNFFIAKGGVAMQLNCQAFQDKGDIPKKYVMPGAGGENLSLPLSWSGAPEGTKSFALSIVDSHPVANNWVHWLVVNIPAEVDELPEGASGRNMPEGSKELDNSFGKNGYGGPQPPKGTGEHPYEVTVYALNVEKLDLGKSVSLDDFQQATSGKVLDQAKTTGMYEQK